MKEPLPVSEELMVRLREAAMSKVEAPVEETDWRTPFPPSVDAAKETGAVALEFMKRPPPFTWNDPE
jgi:hypothetical protein